MIEISVTYTDIRGTKLTFDFATYRFKKHIEQALDKQYQLPEDQLLFIDIEAVADNPALHHLVEQVDWGFLYDSRPEIISFLFHIRDDAALIKILWLHVNNGMEIMDASDKVKMGICSIHESKRALYSEWLKENEVHPDITPYINMHDVLEDRYPTIETLGDGKSVIVLNW